MKERQLIGMVDYVLEHEIKEWDKSKRTGNQVAVNCEKYAHFLNQPLTLGMFVPCDEDGNVLEEPEKWSESWSFEKKSKVSKKNENYIKAKERVIFEGFTGCDYVENNMVYFKRGRFDSKRWCLISNMMKCQSGNFKTIKDLVKINYQFNLNESTYNKYFK